MNLFCRLLCKGWEVGTSTLHRMLTWREPASKWLLDRWPAPPQAGPRVPKPLGLLIVIPFRDRAELTKECLRTCLTQTGLAGVSVRIALVDNGSEEPETVQWLKGLPAQVPLGETAAEVHVLRLEIPFNFSTLNNQAIGRLGKEGDLILCLNNDVTFTSPTSLQTVVDFFQTPGAGAVGATLRYPSGKLQHAFLAPGVKLGGCHPWKGARFPRESEPWFAAPRAVPAVTGAFLAFTKAAFDQVGGYDEALATSCQDLDLCLAFGIAGLTNWALPQVELIHHENATRSRKLNTQELRHLYKKWGPWVTDHPGLPAQLSRWSETPVPRRFEGPYPWRNCLRL